MIQSDTEKASTPSSQDGPEVAARTKNVRFERLMSFEPSIGRKMFGREPCLRDMIHGYYTIHFHDDPQRVDDLTKRYIEKLWQANLL